MIALIYTAFESVQTLYAYINC